jgi:hypothetical protein
LIIAAMWLGAICFGVPGLFVALNIGRSADQLSRTFPWWFGIKADPFVFRANGVAFVIVAVVFVIGAVATR